MTLVFNGNEYVTNLEFHDYSISDQEVVLFKVKTPSEINRLFETDDIELYLVFDNESNRIICHSDNLMNDSDTCWFTVDIDGWDEPLFDNIIYDKNDLAIIKLHLSIPVLMKTNA